MKALGIAVSNAQDNISGQYSRVAGDGGPGDVKGAVGDTAGRGVQCEAHHGWECANGENDAEPKEKFSEKLTKAVCVCVYLAAMKTMIDVD